MERHGEQVSFTIIYTFLPECCRGVGDHRGVRRDRRGAQTKGAEKAEVAHQVMGRHWELWQQVKLVEGHGEGRG